MLVSHGFFNHFLTGDVDEEANQTTPWWAEGELRTYRFVDEKEAASVPAFIGGGSTVDGQDGAMIKETEESLRRLAKRRASVVKNVNRPAERKQTLANYQTDQNMALNPA